MTQAQAAILALAFLAGEALAVTTNEDGYEVTRSQSVVPVPHGKVGRKTIDRETRAGNTEETDGNSTNTVMTLGGFMSRCPMPEGNAPVKFVAAGDFEVSIVSDTIDTDVVPTERKHYEKRFTARIKVFVNDDQFVTEGEIDGEFSSNMDGVRTGPIRVRKRFPIRAYGMPDFDALLEIATATGDMAAAALMWNSSMTILEAQLEWRKPNVCADLEFDPPSESRSVSSGEAVDVRVKYRTRDGQQAIPKGKWNATVVQGGQVREASGQVSPDGTFVVHYVARSSSAPKEGDGVRIDAWSAAGFAQKHWKIRTGLRLAIEHHLVSRRDVPGVLVGGPIFVGTVNFELAMEPFPTLSGEFRGEATVVREMGIGHIASKCTGSATQSETWQANATIDPQTGTLKLGITMFADDMDAYWDCVHVGRDEITSYVGSEFDLVNRFSMPARSGSRHEVTLNGPEFEETLTVTIP